MYNFKSNGYILKKNVLSENRCLELINEINKLETYLLKNKPEQNGRLQLENDHKLKKIQCSLDISKKMCELSVDLNIINTVKELMSSNNIYLWEDKIHYKHPKIGSEYKWHCDYNNWNDSRSKDFITCMIFLEDTNDKNGCLQVIPGSNNEYEKYPTNQEKNLPCNFKPGYYNKDFIDSRSTFIESIDQETRYTM